MQQPDVFFYILKLILGGMTAFLAILLFSRTQDGAWMSLVAGAITEYAGIVYEMLIKLGLVSGQEMSVAGIPLLRLFFTAVPPLFFILAFIMMIHRTGK